MKHLPGSIGDDIKHERRITFAIGESTAPGLFTIEVFHHSLCAPIGIVWYRFTDNTKRSYVDERYRRLGLRTLLNSKLFVFFPTIERITTDGGSDSGGSVFLKASGYKKLPRNQGWELKRPK